MDLSVDLGYGGKVKRRVVRTIGERDNDNHNHQNMLSGHFKIGFKSGVLIVLQSLSAPIITIGVLVAATRIHDVFFGDAYLALAIISALLSYISLRSYLNQDWSLFSSSWIVARRIAMSWIVVVSVLLLMGYATKFSAEFSRRVLFTWFVMTPPVLVGALIWIRYWLRREVVRSGAARTAVIVGVNPASRLLAESIRTRPELGLVFRGFFDDRSEERLGLVEPNGVVGRLADLSQFTKTEGIDCVFIAIPLSYVERTKTLLEKLQDTTASIYFVPDIFVFDLIQARISDLNGIPVVALCETPFKAGHGLLKRGSDIVLSSLILLVVAPCMVVIAVVIKLTSRGSVIFKQRRYGLDGEEITIYKFRTMSVSEDGEKIMQATRGDSRVTAVGRILRKYSLDELPQLVNVLQGRMSVVGPRPHAVAHNETYRQVIGGYMRRHKVTPGITGLAQVNGCRGETTTIADMEKRVRYDLEYLRSWSLLLDAKILLRTAVICFRDEKAY